MSLVPPKMKKKNKRPTIKRTKKRELNADFESDLSSPVTFGFGVRLFTREGGEAFIWSPARVTISGAEYFFSFNLISGYYLNRGPLHFCFYCRVRILHSDSVCFDRPRLLRNQAKTCNFASKLSCFGVLINFSAKSCKKCLISWKTMKNHRFGQNLQLFEQNCKVSWLETPSLWRYKENYGTRKLSGLSRNGPQK